MHSTPPHLSCLSHPVLPSSSHPSTAASHTARPLLNTPCRPSCASFPGILCILASSPYPTFQPSQLTSPSHLSHPCLRTALPIVLSSFRCILCIIFPIPLYPISPSDLICRTRLGLSIASILPSYPFHAFYSASSILPFHLIHPVLIYHIYHIYHIYPSILSYSILFYPYPILSLPSIPPPHGLPVYTWHVSAVFL